MAARQATQKVWENVGEQFETLSKDLRLHFDKAGADASAERAALEQSVRGLIKAVEESFDAAGKAVRNPVLRTDVGNVADSIRHAFLISFESAEGQVRGRLGRPRQAAKPTGARAGTARNAPAKSSSRKAPAAK